MEGMIINNNDQQKKHPPWTSTSLNHNNIENKASSAPEGMNNNIRISKFIFVLVHVSVNRIFLQTQIQTIKTYKN